MTPHAQTSTAGVLIFYFPLKISGDIYFKVPVSASLLNWSATPLIPKSAILMIDSVLLLNRIF
jgi:hypothetical protein